MKREDVLKTFHAHARWYKQEPNGSRADFTDVDLSGSDLSATNFNGATFVRTKLVGATMSCANFYGADFTGADLQRAYLSCADMHGTNLTNAVLDCANLANVDLSGANLTGASFVNAYLYTANLDDVTLNWDSHDLVVEILRRYCKGNEWKLRVSGAILMDRLDGWYDRLPWYCGPGEDGDNMLEWTLAMLELHVKDGDNAPAMLKDRSDLYE